MLLILNIKLFIMYIENKFRGDETFCFCRKKFSVGFFIMVFLVKSLSLTLLQ